MPGGPLRTGGRLKPGGHWCLVVTAAQQRPPHLQQPLMTGGHLNSAAHLNPGGHLSPAVATSTPVGH